MFDSFQDIVDAMFTHFGIIPSMTVVIFPLTLLTFLIVSTLDSSTTTKRGIRLFFYIGAPANIIALLFVIVLTNTGVVSSGTVNTNQPVSVVHTHVESVETGTAFLSNNPTDTEPTRDVTTTNGLTLDYNNSPSELQYLAPGDDVTITEYSAQHRHLFKPATTVPMFVVNTSEEVPK